MYLMEEDSYKRHSLSFLQKKILSQCNLPSEILSSQVSSLSSACNLGTIAQGTKKSTYHLTPYYVDSMFRPRLRFSKVESYQKQKGNRACSINRVCLLALDMPDSEISLLLVVMHGYILLVHCFPSSSVC